MQLNIKTLVNLLVCQSLEDRFAVRAQCSIFHIKNRPWPKAKNSDNRLIIHSTETLKLTVPIFRLYKPNQSIHFFFAFSLTSSSIYIDTEMTAADSAPKSSEYPTAGIISGIASAGIIK